MLHWLNRRPLFDASYQKRETIQVASFVVMKAKDFVAEKSFRLAAITKHPKVGLADSERGCNRCNPQYRLIQQAYLGTRERAIVVLEGWDTAGKGGLSGGWAGRWTREVSKCIPSPPRCRTSVVDTTCNASGRSFPSRVRSWSSTAPGTAASWSSGSESLASKREWQRGYEEINQFERMMAADGIRIAKCFLHITPAEQIRRFKDRLANPLKRWKLSYEDFRNRAHWADYEIAIEEMMHKTSTKQAPWYLVPTNDKLYGRLAVFTILVDILGNGLRLKPAPAGSQDRRDGEDRRLTFPSAIRRLAHRGAI